MPATAPIRQILYVSRAVPPASATALDAILHISRRNNRRSDLTGCLMYSGRHFVQVLEGPADSVEAALERIQADPRHTALRVLMDGQTIRRRYGEWEMGGLFSLDVADRLEAIAEADPPDPAEVAQLLELVRPDEQMGAR